MISVPQLTILVYAALAVTAVAPLTLVVLFVRDMREGTIW
jgi:hypothetical protein